MGQAMTESEKIRQLQYEVSYWINYFEDRDKSLESNCWVNMREKMRDLGMWNDALQGRQDFVFGLWSGND
jgi:hypothetical protein